MRNRILFFAAVPLLFVASVSAQTAAAGNVAPSCASGASMPNLGFSYFLRMAQGGALSAGSYSAGTSNPFPDEPLISNIDENGPAGDRVQEGDRIARVNGYAITSVEGTSALRNARPGTALVLTLRRGDRMIPVTITPSGWRCGFGRQPLSVTGGQAPRGAISATGVYTPSVAAMTVTGGSMATVAGGSLLRTPTNAGWLGLAFDCNNCGQRATPDGRVWYFNEPPVIYNVDTGSPAYNAGIRRGDVLLRIDNKDVQSPAAGARLGLVKPGETLRLTLRRDGRTRDASLKVAPSPAMQGNTVALRSADQLLKSTQELLLTTKQSHVRALMNEYERSHSAQQSSLNQLEREISKDASNAQARSAINKLRSAQEAEAKKVKQMLTEMLRTEEEGSRKLELVEQQMKHATAVAQPSVYVIDSVAPYSRSTLREQRLRYSGSVGDADIEVRGPGSVTVQGEGDDIVIITSDAVIRVKNRKIRDRE